MALEAQDNPFPYVTLTETADPSTPAANTQRLWLDTDGVLKVIDEADVVTPIISASGAVGTDAIWDAAGDLAVGSGANTAARLAIGTTNHVAKVAGGTVAWGLPHAWGCVISGTSTALSTNAYVSVSYGAADTYDPDGYHDPSGAPTLITIPANLGGVYRLTAHCSWPNTTTADSQKRITYRVNGGTDFAPIPYRTFAVEGIGTTGYATTSAVIVLAAGDTVEVRQWVTNANAQTTVDYSASLFLIGVA